MGCQLSARAQSGPGGLVIDTDLVNASAGAVDAGVARGIRRCRTSRGRRRRRRGRGEFDAAEPGVLGEEEVRAVLARRSRSRWRSRISRLVRRPWMLMVKRLSRYSAGQLIALVDHHADVGVAAAEARWRRRRGIRPACRWCRSASGRRAVDAARRRAGSGRSVCGRT